MGRKKKPPPRPLPRFEKWISETGAGKVATALHVSIDTVRKWQQAARGHKHGALPGPQKLVQIIRASGGALTVADIYPAER